MRPAFSRMIRNVFVPVEEAHGLGLGLLGQGLFPQGFPDQKNNDHRGQDEKNGEDQVEDTR